MMSQTVENFGSYIKSLREKKRLSLEEMAAKTKISLQYLSALEENRLAELPRTPNGKVNRLALPEAAPARSELDGAYAPARTPLEEHLVSLWQEILRVGQIGIRDNFFAHGGHSLLAIQMIGRLRHDLQVDLSVATLFQNPSIEDFAVAVLERLLEQESLEKAQAGAPIAEAAQQGGEEMNASQFQTVSQR